MLEFAEQLGVGSEQADAVQWVRVPGQRAARALTRPAPLPTGRRVAEVST